MPITEFISPHINPTAVKQLLEVLPATAKTTFAGTPGLLAFYRGRILHAQNVSDKTTVEHSGIALLLEWDELSSFHALWVSDRLANFKQALRPYMLRPVEPDLFYSGNQPLSGGTTSAKYTQLFKVGGIESSNKKKVEDSWHSLVSQLQGNASTFYAWGVENTAGGLAGMIGWNSLEALQAANEQQSVRDGLEILAKYGKVISYVLELERQPY